MILSCLQENLARGLNIVGRAVSTRSTLPVLGNVLLETDNGRLKLSATNLEIVVTCWIGAKVEQEVNVEYCRSLDIPIVRRCSGGATGRRQLLSSE